MASLPLLKSGVLCKYPVEHSQEFRTRVIRFLDDSEQRFTVRPPLQRFSLVYRAIDAEDLTRLRQFWESMKGQFDASWSLDWNGEQIERCRFDSDEFKFVESHFPSRFDVILHVVQVRATA